LNRQDAKNRKIQMAQRANTFSHATAPRDAFGNSALTSASDSLVLLSVIAVTYCRFPGPPLGRLAPRRGRLALTPGRPPQNGGPTRCRDTAQRVPRRGRARRVPIRRMGVARRLGSARGTWTSAANSYVIEFVSATTSAAPGGAWEENASKWQWVPGAGRSSPKAKRPAGDSPAPPGDPSARWVRRGSVAAGSRRGVAGSHGVEATFHRL
jgi:hypothetical protein